MLFFLIPLTSSLSALISSETKWAICSYILCSEVQDVDPRGSWACHRLLTHKSEIPLSPSSALALCCMESQFTSLTYLKVLGFAKVIFCSFSKWNWCAMGSDLCQSWLKVEDGMGTRAKQERAGWCEDCWFGLKNAAICVMMRAWLWLSTTVQTSFVNLGEQCCPFLPRIHVTTTG